MVVQTFTIRVEVLNCDETDAAIANAGTYLAHGDVSNTINRSPLYHSVEVYKISSGPIGVTLSLDVRIKSDEHLKEFMDALSSMSRVQSVERDGPSLDLPPN
jgi:hypothetical protein